MRRHNAIAGVSAPSTETQDQEVVYPVIQGLDTIAGEINLASGWRQSAAILRKRSVIQAKTAIEETKQMFVTYSKFIGPGFMISVAYSKHFPSISSSSC